VVVKNIICMLAMFSALVVIGLLQKHWGLINKIIGRPWNDRCNWIHRKIFLGYSKEAKTI
jgi:hypothetical protein